MSKGRILVVEDDLDISNMLRIYFDSQGYEVIAAVKGNEALDKCRRKLPDVIVLDINLPDMDGFDVCRRLRGNLRTSQIPIIFLTQRDDRIDKIAGLELGADDYITKPFDIEELKLRVQGTLRRAMFESLTNPITALPSGKLIEDQLKKIKTLDNWTLLYLGIKDIDAFTELQGFVARDDVLRFAKTVIKDAVENHGTINDFVGHTAGDDFIIITEPETGPAICQEVCRRFSDEVKVFYPYGARQKGKVVIEDGRGHKREANLMTFSVGLVRSTEGPFSDIRQITEVAAEARRHDTGCR
jgi:PleD family two-component response regulator